MEDLNKIISVNLKKIREEKKYSLDELAKITDVSRSMLGQIERGDSNPSISTVWKIANGLKIPFTDLTMKQEIANIIINRDEIEPVTADNNKVKVYPFFPYEDGRPFEIYELNIEKGGYSFSDPHQKGTVEFIIVYDGEVCIRVAEEEYNIKGGNSFRFQADNPHSYHNIGGELVRLTMIIHYT